MSWVYLIKLHNQTDILTATGVINCEDNDRYFPLYLKNELK